MTQIATPLPPRAAPLADDADAADDDALELAAERIRRGGLVAFPTETVYGLGVNALDSDAVRRLYDVKGRPRSNPLIVHVADSSAAERLGVLDSRARRLADALWPGAVTLIAPKRAPSPLAVEASAGLESVALRVPARAAALRLLRRCGVPVAAPSANRSGRVSPTRAEHVVEALGDVLDPDRDLILDGGACDVGIESATVSLMSETPRLLRSGGVSRERIEAILEEPLGDADSFDAARSPGMAEAHYAPRAALRLEVVDDVAPDEALLAFGDALPPHRGACLNLSPRGDLREAAANLYSHLHALDRASSRIAAMPIPRRGLGEAINDRLRRAAGKTSETTSETTSSRRG